MRFIKMILTILLLCSCSEKEGKKSIKNFKCAKNEVCILYRSNEPNFESLNKALKLEGKEYTVNGYSVQDILDDNGFENIYDTNNLSIESYLIKEYIKEFDLFIYPDRKDLIQKFINEDYLKPINKKVVNIFPEILTSQFNYKDKIFALPVDFTILNNTEIHSLEEPWYFASVQKDLIGKSDKDYASLINIIIKNKDETNLLSNTLWGGLFFPNYSPVISSLSDFPIVINEKERKVELLYTTDDFIKFLEIINYGNNNDKYSQLYNENYKINFFSSPQNNQVGFIENPISTYNISDHGIFIINNGKNLGEVFIEDLYFSEQLSTAINESPYNLTYYGNLDLIPNSMKESHFSKNNITYTNLAKFYQKNLSCAYGFQFDFSKVDQNNLDLLEFNNFLYGYNASNFSRFNFDLYRHLNSLSADRIVEELDRQLQAYLEGE
ncbi:MAG: hypothetical protein RR674_03350 [Anaerorhabdus sp.]|jgi:hypothetical protein